MFLLSNLLNAVAQVMDIILTALYWLVIVRALISWVSPDPYNPVVQFLYKVTEPVLYPIRKMLPFSLKFGIDISPVIAFLAIIFLKSFLVASLGDLALRLRMAG